MSDESIPETDEASVDEALRRVLDDVVAPLIRRDGAELTWVRRADDVVELRAGGSLRGCPGRQWTLRHVVLPALRRAHPSVRDVRVE